MATLGCPAAFQQRQTVRVQTSQGSMQDILNEEDQDDPVPPSAWWPSRTIQLYPLTHALHYHQRLST